MLHTICVQDTPWVIKLRKEARQLLGAVCDMIASYKSFLRKCATIFMAVKIGIILLATITTMVFLLNTATSYLSVEMSKGHSTARHAIPQPAADLAGVPYGSRSRALGALLAALADALARFARAGFAAFREEWEQRHAFQGARVRLTVASERAIEGIASGVADDGALLLETGAGVQRYYAGEVSLRTA